LNEWRWRSVVLIAVIAISVPLLTPCRSVPDLSTAAFLYHRPDRVTVSVKNQRMSSGIYQYHDGICVDSVKLMTYGKREFNVKPVGVLATKLHNGDSIEFNETDQNIVEIKINKMSYVESSLVGIPLELNQLTGDDWSLIPGIGPGMATAIVSNRQKYGAFAGIDDLQRVPGIGKGTVDRLKKYLLFCN
jgi:competence ComEA-like helix-hairpin-helix protein